VRFKDGIPHGREATYHTEGRMLEYASTLKDEDLARNIELTIGGPEKRSMLLGHLTHLATSTSCSTMPNSAIWRRN